MKFDAAIRALTILSPAIEPDRSMTSATLIGFINIWINDNWPKAPETAAAQKPAVTACATALGLGDKAASPSYRNPENLDTVADHCKVHSNLTKFVVAKKGTIK